MGGAVTPGTNPDMLCLNDPKHLDILMELRQPRILPLVCAVLGYVSV